MTIPTADLQRKCEACGSEPNTLVRATNGSLRLCGQCLGELNAKSPEVPVLREAMDRLRKWAFGTSNVWRKLEDDLGVEGVMTMEGKLPGDDLPTVIRKMKAERDRLQAQLAASEARTTQLGHALSALNQEICQTLGAALGYPRFCDDLKNFPNTKPEDGVCVGEHIAETLATEVARKLAASEAAVVKLRQALEPFADLAERKGAQSPLTFSDHVPLRMLPGNLMDPSPSLGDCRTAARVWKETER